ncbi:LacI family DNA-binding transcriptional regulator [Enemella evansiae]|uniref:LacI family DNA-binding transcriptional regulator n=1 Tax=Enemella evansiae TaxID=2016499 RepID=UPI0014150EEB|nr:LacI family DNA-binding transcriptional regulator [Enemella evansiae]
MARAAQVSLKTVSRVVNEEANVSPEMAEKVRRAADSLGYRHNRMAALLRSGRSGMISLIIRDLTNSFYSAVAVGAEAVVESQRSLLVISSHEARLDRQQELLEVMLNHRADGIILAPAAGIDPLLKAEVARGMPVVAIDVEPPGTQIDSVTFDNRRAARDAVDEAIRMGASRFAMIFESYQLATMGLRRDGAVDALRAHGLEVRPELIRDGAQSSAEAHAIAAELMAAPDPPDAIFCGNNIAAVGAAGLTRGKNVTLISFDDFPLSTVLKAPVVIVDHDAREMGATAAEMLFQRIADPTRPVRRAICPTVIKSRKGNREFSTVEVARKSTG